MKLSELMKALEEGKSIKEPSGLIRSLESVEGVKFFIARYEHSGPSVESYWCIDPNKKYEICEKLV